MSRPTASLDDLLAAPTRAAIYNRVSLDKEADEQAVTRQNDAAVALAEHRGWEVVDTFTDNSISASKRDVIRPAYEKMLSDYRAGHFTVIIVQDLDRLTRQPRQLEDWIDEAERGDLRIVTLNGEADLGTDGGRMYARIKAAVARGEVERKGERQKLANTQRAQAGHWQFSRRPYGYERRDGAVVVVEEEAEVLREAYRRVNAGETYYAIGEDLNERGVRTVGGTSWTPRQMARTLDNAHYAGILTHNGKRLDVAPQWEPIIDRRTWDDYTSMRQNRKRPSGWSSATKHMMSGLAVCGVCGARMLARPDRGIQVYSCKESWCVSITGEDLDPVVEKLVLARLRNRKVLHALRESPDTGPVEREIAELGVRLSDVTDLLAEGVLDRARAREQAQKLSGRIERLNRRLTAMRQESPLTDLAVAGRGLAKLWKGKTVVEKRRVITELGLRVTVAKGKPGRRPRDAGGNRIPDLDRLTLEWLDQDVPDSSQDA
ncbi:recombinase family protein [Brachybacterium alimentarium]|uniref:recombinase family protein n=1 Tax=Brachybacterium alimentarium TaxID=47845 RepID=UPI000DF1ACC4|nr:recombinase family protein [Brachybacterium alimentarium]RCS63679.1 recombinase family protein [Brachybacterium alimentarium]